MMRDSWLLLIVVFSILFILSFVWYRILTAPSKMNAKKEKKQIKKAAFLKKIELSHGLQAFMVVCAALLINSDEEIKNALEYIEPSRHTDSILEILYEQRRI